MGTLEQMGTLGPIGIGASGHWGQMHGHFGKLGTRKNEHQGKWAIGANRHFGANGHFGTDGHRGKWAFGENSHQEK